MVMTIRIRMSNRSAERRFNCSLPVLAFCSELRKIAFRPVSSRSTTDKERRNLYISWERMQGIHCLSRQTRMRLTKVARLENQFNVSSKKVFSQPCSVPHPTAARSGPWQIHSASSSTKLWVLLIRLCILL